MSIPYKSPSCNFVAIDIEYATSQEQSICQFGLSIVRDAQIVDTKCWLIQPKGNLYSNRTTDVHGMSAEVTSDSPTLPEVWPLIASYLDGAEIWAHNAASVEAPILEKNLNSYGIPHEKYQIYDSMRLYVRPDKDRWNEGNGLEPCLYALGLPCNHHHDAGMDAAMCARIVIAAHKGKEPDWQLSDRMMERVNAERERNVAETRALHQAQQLDLFSEALTSTTQVESESKLYTPTFFDKDYNETEDGCDDIDYDRLHTTEDNPLYGCNVVVTGFFHVARRHLLKAIDIMGAKRSNNITKKTQVVLIGERNVGPRKLSDITTLIHNGYNIARVTGDIELDRLLYDTNLGAKDFAIPEPAKKELNFTLGHYQKNKCPLCYPNNSIASKELYFPNHFRGDFQLLSQICGNLGAFGNWDLNPQVTHVVLPISTVAILQQRGKDEVIKEYEDFYNRSRSVTFDASFITEHDILKYARERIVRHNDEVTKRLYVGYLLSAGIDPEKDFKYGLAVARKNFEKEQKQEMDNSVSDDNNSINNQSL